jgi:hypothetical protein
MYLQKVISRKLYLTDPHPNVMDPQHCFLEVNFLLLEYGSEKLLLYTVTS